MSKAISMDETEFRLLVQDKFTNIKKLLKKNNKLFTKFKNTIVTMGKNGAYHISKGEINFIDSIIKSSKDSTGCGDVFFSTYIILDIFSNLNLSEKIIICHLCAGIHAEYEGNKNRINKDNLVKFSKSYLF